MQCKLQQCSKVFTQYRLHSFFVYFLMSLLAFCLNQRTTCYSRLSSTCRPLGSNSGIQACQQLPLPAEPLLALLRFSLSLLRLSYLSTIFTCFPFLHSSLPLQRLPPIPLKCIISSSIIIDNYSFIMVLSNFLF